MCGFLQQWRHRTLASPLLTPTTGLATPNAPTLSLSRSCTLPCAPSSVSIWYQRKALGHLPPCTDLADIAAKLDCILEQSSPPLAIGWTPTTSALRGWRSSSLWRMTWTSPRTLCNHNRIVAAIVLMAKATMPGIRSVTTTSMKTATVCPLLRLAPARVRKPFCPVYLAEAVLLYASSRRR